MISVLLTSSGINFYKQEFILLFLDRNEISQAALTNNTVSESFAWSFYIHIL